MPTYAPQLQAFRNRVNYLEPNLDPIYKGLDIRQQRHDNLQSNYANYVDSVVKDETLDPVEKQKRLDGLKDTVYNMYNKYNGNLSDARDEVLNLIVENRKDPYWSLDRQRTAGYNDMKAKSAALAAQGLTPLYQDASGKYLQDPMERFKSLTDERGNYVNPAQFNVMPTKQLDYEAYFDNVLKTIKANVSDLGLSHKMSENELSDLVKGYLTTGKIISTDANINRALPGILENFRMSPEWKQMEGVYGPEQAGILASNMMKNAANRYRYTQQDVNYSPINYSSDELKTKAGGKGKDGQSYLWDRNVKPLTNTGEQFDVSEFLDPKTGNLKTEKDYPLNPIDKVNSNLNTVGVTNQPIGMQIDTNATRKKKLDRLNKVNKQLSLIRGINPAYKDMTDAEIAKIGNSYIQSGYGDIIHTFPNSAITTLGGEDIFNDETGNSWKDKMVYVKDGNDGWKLVKEQSNDLGDWDKKELAGEVFRKSPKSDLIFARDKNGKSLGAGYYASNGSGVEVFIPVSAAIKKGLEPLEKLEETERKLSSLNADRNYEIQRGVDGNAVVFRTSNGLMVLDADVAPSTLQKIMDQNKTTDEIAQDMINSGLNLRNIDEYNNYMKSKLIPVEEIGDTQ